MIEPAAVRDRVTASLGVAALHLLLAVALIAGFGVQVAVAPVERLTTFDVIEPPPPPEEPVDSAPRPEGEAAPASLRKASPTPVVTPPPRVELPVPAAPAAGAAPLHGQSTGTGGEGTGTGSGGQGSGTGGGGTGAGRSAERIAGRLSGASDYPRGARRAGIEGSVAVSYIVGVNGRVSGCRVIRSSGNAELDSTTCRLIEQRFRYRPARDAAGNPVPETIRRTFDWMLPFRR